jgi:hypothetical protein
VQIVPSKSEVEPLIQVADLLTAMAAFSRTPIETYRRWKERESGRENLLEKEEQTLTVGEREKCAVLSGFRDRCHRCVWHYEPQRQADKAAPTRTPRLI